MHTSAEDTHNSCQLWIHSQLRNSRCQCTLSVSIMLLRTHRSAEDTHSSCQLWIHSHLGNSSCQSVLSVSAMLQTHTSAGIHTAHVNCGYTVIWGTRAARVYSQSQLCCKCTHHWDTHSLCQLWRHSKLRNSSCQSAFSAMLQMHRSAGYTRSSCQLWIHSQLRNSSCQCTLSVSIMVLRTHRSAEDTHSSCQLWIHSKLRNSSVRVYSHSQPSCKRTYQLRIHTTYVNCGYTVN